MASFGITTSVPIFDGENYDYWSKQMKTYFLSQDLWDVVEKGVANISPEGGSNSEQHKEESTKDAKALLALQKAVSEFILPRLRRDANTSKRAWEILQSEFQKNAKLKIIKKFEYLKMKESEEVKKYYSRLIEIVNQMRAHGEEVTNQRIVQKILISLPEKYNHIIEAIGESKDLQILSVTDLMGLLQAYEQTMAGSSDGSLEHAHAFQLKGQTLMINLPAINDFTKKEQLQCDNYEVVIDMAELDFPLPAAECCIYRVPKRLREVNPMAYTPRLVSIGPFHYSLRKELKEMERQKHRYLRDFLTRNKNDSMRELARIIQDNEVSIRRCYSETFLLSSDEFVNIILLDAMFILELFWGICNKSKADKKKDYILSQPIMESGIKHDLLLLENQLPFFVLVKLYSCCYQRNETGNILLEQSCNFFRAILYNGQAAEPEIDEVKHFTDMLRSIFLPPKPSNNEIDENKCTARYSATKLDEAGLKFTRATSGGSLSEIKMSENCCLEKFPFFNLSWLLACLPCLKYSCLTRMQRFLKIPHLCVDDNTEGLFRNLMAFEQCHYPSEPYICEYVVLLDDLITTDADVSLLVDKEIIDNLLGSSTAVTTLFNRLALEIQVPERSLLYGKLYKDLGKYCDSFWNRLVGTLTRVYFTDLFKGTATLAGIIVLVITVWNFCKDL